MIRATTLLGLLVGLSAAHAQPARPPPAPATPPPPPDATPPAAPDPAGSTDATEPDPTLPADPASTPPADTEPEPDAEPDEDLLANIREPQPGDTLGTRLALFGVEVTWSGHGEVVGSLHPNQREATFDALSFNPVLSARMTDTLTGEFELELEHAGREIHVEYAMIDWTPFQSRAFVVRSGLFQTPLGKFNEQYHPSYRYPQVTRPLMFAEVVPVGLSDVGLQLRGLIGRETSFEYQVWLTNGLGIPEAASEGGEAGHDEGGGFVAGLRGNVIDNNFDKTVGARVGINVGRPSGPVSGTFAASGQSGKIDAPGAVRLTIVDLDASFTAGGLVLNAEGAASFLGRKGSYFERFEQGAYVQLAYTIERWTPAVRWDYVKLAEPEGGEEGEEGEEGEGQQQVAGSVRFSPAPQWSVRLEVAVPVVPEGQVENTSVAGMLSFVF